MAIAIPHNRISWPTAFALVLSGAALTAALLGGFGNGTPEARAQAEPAALPAPVPAPAPRMVTTMEYVPAPWIYNRKTQLNDDIDVRKAIDGLAESIDDAEAQGWQLTHVTPLVMPVYRFKTDGLSQWGFGVGASMTRGYFLYFQRPAE
ncbi:MAG: hypothetical protein AAGI68_09840 [Planctomycetota bacterium]